MDGTLDGEERVPEGVQRVRRLRHAGSEVTERLVFDCNCLAQCLRSYGGPRGRGSFLRAKYPCNRTSSACAPPACQGGGEGTGCWVEDLDFRVEV